MTSHTVILTAFLTASSKIYVKRRKAKKEHQYILTMKILQWTVTSTYNMHMPTDVGETEPNDTTAIGLYRVESVNHPERY